MLTASEVIEAPFRLIRQQPVAVAIWGLPHLALVVASFLVMRPVQSALVSGNPQAVSAGFGMMLGRMIPLYVFSLALWTVTIAAAQRAILRPERSGFFYLRLGMDELRMTLLAIVLFILSYIGLVALGIAAGVFVMTFGAAMGVGLKTLLLVPIGLALVALFIWVEVRLSLVFPLTLLRRRIVIGESWRLTKGRFWTLFGAYLVLFLLMCAIWIAVASVTGASYMSALMKSGLNPAGMNRASQAQIVSQLVSINVLTVVGWVVSAAAGAVGTAMIGGGVATAARALATDREGIAETFA
jgi:hypothetical protein